MSAKVKYPRSAALAVATELFRTLREYCALLPDGKPAFIVAGSLRRRKSDVGDVEILFIPKFEEKTLDFFAKVSVSLVDEVLISCLVNNVLIQRKNVNGSTMWGAKNKLAVHVASGIPVDFFAATAENWFNYLVCRTGGAESNMAICNAAIARRWKWNPYGAGFTDERGQIRPVTSERQVFELVGLEYLEPWERNADSVGMRSTASHSSLPGGSR